ncbi:type 2 periplasmic-binding domain-containing protein [Chitinimonas naiadis]
MRRSVIIATLCGLLAPFSWGVEISGAGSSAAAPLYSVWANAYQRAASGTVRYDAIGSSKGLQAIKDRKVDFGASDVPPSAADLAKSGLVVFPTAITGVVPVVNLPGVKAGQLKLDGDLLAKIFMGQITRWNDAAIVARNEGIALPAKTIQVIGRSDGSGSTYNFSNYLSSVSKEWKGSLGTGFTLKWADATTQVKGSDAVVAALKSRDYSIAYVDFAYVLENDLTDVKLANAAGKFIKADKQAFTEALMNSAWPSRGDFEDTLVNKPGAGSWPITMGTFVMMPSVAEDAQKATVAANFFVWGFLKGDRLANSLAFVRLPDSVQGKASTAIAAIRDKSGKVLPLSYY